MSQNELKLALSLSLENKLTTLILYAIIKHSGYQGFMHTFKKILFCFAFFIYSSVILGEERPDLYLDGKILANTVADGLKKSDLKHALSTKKIPNMMDHLAAGFSFSNRHDDYRNQLMNWVLSQPDHSIYPHEFILKSIQIRGGNVQDGLMLAYDHLVDGWYRSDSRNAYEHTLKLVDITGELSNYDGSTRIYGERKTSIARKALNFPFINKGAPTQTIRGDNFSAWYHFLGVTLSTYMSSRSINPMPAGWTNKTIVFVNEYIFSGTFIDGEKRLKIDLAAPDFATQLIKLLKKPHLIKNKSQYLYENSSQYGQKWKLKPGQLPGDYGTNEQSRNGPTMMESILTIRKLNPNSPSDLKRLIKHIEDGNNKLNHISLRQHHAANQIYIGPTNVLAKKAAEVILSLIHI